MSITKIKTEAPDIGVTLGDLKAGDLFKFHLEPEVYMVTDERGDAGGIRIIELKTGGLIFRDEEDEVVEFHGELTLTRIKKREK